MLDKVATLCLLRWNTHDTDILDSGSYVSFTVSTIGCRTQCNTNPVTLFLQCNPAKTGNITNKRAVFWMKIRVNQYFSEARRAVFGAEKGRINIEIRDALLIFHCQLESRSGHLKKKDGGRLNVPVSSFSIDSRQLEQRETIVKWEMQLVYGRLRKWQTMQEIAWEKRAGMREMGSSSRTIPGIGIAEL